MGMDIVNYIRIVRWYKAAENVLLEKIQNGHRHISYHIFIHLGYTNLFYRYTIPL